MSEIKKYILCEDIPSPTLKMISPNYRMNFVGLDFNKVSLIRFMKEVKRVGDSLIIPLMYDRFEIYGLNELPIDQDNYITYDKLWEFKKELMQSPIIRAS